MAKFTDAWRTTLSNYFNSGDQPTEVQFAQLMQSIQEGIDDHDHSGVAGGDGIAVFAGPGIDVPNNWYIGIGAALERIVFEAAGNIKIKDALFGVGRTPSKALHVAGDDNAEGDPAYDGSCVAVFQRNTAAGTPAGIDIISGTTDEARINFGDKDASGRGRIAYDNTADFGFRFDAGGNADILVISGAGNVVIPALAGGGNRSIGVDNDGNIIIA